MDNPQTGSDCPQLKSVAIHYHFQILLISQFGVRKTGSPQPNGPLPRRGSAVPPGAESRLVLERGHKVLLQLILCWNHLFIYLLCR